MSEIEVAGYVRDILVSWAAGESINGLREGWSAFRHRNTNALRESMEERFREYVQRNDAAVAELEKKLAKGEAELRSALARLVEDPAFWRVQANFAYQATWEATDERLGMLAYASAGAGEAGISGMSIAEVARVERTVRELDPADVRFLATISLRLKPHRDEPMLNVYALPVTVDSIRCVHVLMASGCLPPQNVGSPTPGYRGFIETQITPLGHAVLRVMDLYLRAVPQDPAPKDSSK